MAAAFVAERAKGTAAPASGFSISIALAGLTLGNHVIGVINIGQPNVGTTGLASVSDNHGNTWQIDESLSATATGSSPGSAIISGYIAAATSGAVTVTLTFSATPNFGYKFEEFSGLAPSNWFDAGNKGVAPASTSLTAVIVPTGAGRLIVAGWGPPAAQSSFTPGSGYTQAGTPRNALREIICEYQIGAPSGSQNATGTDSTAGTGKYSYALAAYIPGGITQTVAKTSSDAAVRGVTLTPGVATQTLRKAVSGSAAFGVSLVVDQAVKKVTSPAVVRGVTLTPSTKTQAIKKVASGAAPHGVSLSFPGAVPQTITVAKVAGLTHLHGVTLTFGNFNLVVGKIASSVLVKGITFHPSTIPLSAGQIHSSIAVRGVTLTSAAKLFSLGKIASGITVRGVALVRVGPVRLILAKIPSHATVRMPCVERTVLVSTAPETSSSWTPAADEMLSAVAATDDSAPFTPDTQEFC